jgi:hypothetical protein
MERRLSPATPTTWQPRLLSCSTLAPKAASSEESTLPFMERKSTTT